MQAPVMHSNLDQLTSRELEILELVAKGVSNTGIGDSLGISYRTVERHVGNIIGKLGPIPDKAYTRIWLMFNYSEAKGLPVAYLYIPDSNKNHVCSVFDPILKCVDCNNLVEIKEN